MFRNFVEQIESELEKNNVVKEFVPLIRDHMRKALLSDLFIHECIKMSLDTIEDNRSMNQWISPPIYHNPNKHITIRLIPWPAFYRNNPHKHKTWSVTGVFFNKVEVFTYESLSEYPIKLKKEKNIAASQREVGYILPECIHSIGNPSARISISIHIFNNLPGIQNSEDNAIWYPAPNRDNLREGFLARALIAFANCLSESEDESRFKTLERIFEFGDIEVKLNVIKVLIRQAPNLADKLYNLILRCNKQ